MGDRRDNDEALTLLLLGGKDDNAGPILDTFLAALALLVPP